MFFHDSNRCILESYLGIRVPGGLTVSGAFAELDFVSDDISVRILADDGSLGCNIDLGSQGVVALGKVHNAAWCHGPKLLPISCDTIPLVIGVIFAFGIEHVIELDLARKLRIVFLVQCETVFRVVFCEELPILPPDTH
jgi:hypothetical protein